MDITRTWAARRPDPRLVADALQIGLALLLFFLVNAELVFPTGNQNTYLVHAAVEAGSTGLRADWFAGTTDPFPLATTLSAAALRVLGPIGIDLLYLACVGAFVVGVLGWGRRAGMLRARDGSLLVAGALLPFAFPWPGFPMEQLLRRGVAEQYILGGYWQPSEAGGAALLGAILLAARGRSLAAAGAVGVGVALHPGSALAGGMVMLLLLACLLQGRRIREAATAAGLCLLLVAPVLAHAAITFAPSDAATFARAQAVLAEERLPHHALPRHWFEANDLVRAALVVAAGLLWWRQRQLRVALLGGTGLVVASILVASWLDRPGLYLLFPWRLLSILVPLALGLVIIRAVGTGAALARAYAGERAIRWAAALTLVAALAHLGLLSHLRLYRSGVVESTWVAEGRLDRRSIDQAYRRDLTELTRWARVSGPQDAVYVVPLDLEAFRLASGRPVFVDWKSHPYRDVEVLAWKRRVDLVRQLAARDGPCQQASYAALHIPGVTHIVAETAGHDVPCTRALFSNGRYAVYEVPAPGLAGLHPHSP